MMKGQISAVMKSLGLLGFQSTDKKKKQIQEAIAELEADLQKLKESEPSPAEADKMSNDDAIAIIKPFGERLKAIKDSFQLK